MRPTLITLCVAAIVFSGCSEKTRKTVDESDVQSEIPVAARRYEPRLPIKTIEVDTHRITVEIADEHSERQKGLMFRSFLPDTVGMLFIFDEEGPHPFWMKNTSLPLAIAFIAADSTITDIKWMKPHDESHYYPSKPILFALETNRGWFVKRNVKPGARVNF